MLDVASSRTGAGASLSTARAIAIRCRSPPDNLTPRSPISVSRPTAAHEQVTGFGRSPGRRTTRRRMRRVAAISKLSRTVPWNRYVSWATSAMPALEPAGARSRMSCREQHAARLRVEEAQQQRDDRRLAGARWTDDREVSPVGPSAPARGARRSRRVVAELTSSRTTSGMDPIARSPRAEFRRYVRLVADSRGSRQR